MRTTPPPVIPEAEMVASSKTTVRPTKAISPPDEGLLVLRLPEENSVPVEKEELGAGSFVSVADPSSAIASPVA